MVLAFHGIAERFMKMRLFGTPPEPHRNPKAGFDEPLTPGPNERDDFREAQSCVEYQES